MISATDDTGDSRKRLASPARLGKKLLDVREALHLSQREMTLKLEVTGVVEDDIFSFEHGIREPTLSILLAYGRLGGIWVDVLIDDELDLPFKLPANPKHPGVRPSRLKRSRRKKTEGYASK